MAENKNAFNPVKEEQDGKRARRAIWTSSVLDAALRGLQQGKKLIANPFYEFNTKLLKGDLVFDRTQDEIDEWKRCASDIVYFADTYCKLMTPEGVKHVKLRDYQRRYLQHLEKNRLSIFLSCRQSGKCVTFLTDILVRTSNDEYNNVFKKYPFNSDLGAYGVPLFEIMNLFRTDFIWKIKYVIYKKLYSYGCVSTLKKCKQFFEIAKYFLTILLCILNIFDLHSKEKLIRSFNVKDLEVWTDSGWHDASSIHETKPFIQYIVKTPTKSITCADNHIFVVDGKQIFAKELVIGSTLQTVYDYERVVSIEKCSIPISMCDLTIDSTDHTYYTNGILSHNTTTSAIFMLHYILFNVDKNALVLGNKRKTAVEILSKCKSIFLELPFFLKPGIYKWNEGEIVLDNGCRLMAEATTVNSGISFTFHCVLADEFAHIKNTILEKFYNNLFPTITAGRARFMITSTQNGYNLFYRLYKSAEAGENEYAPFKVDWPEVPEWNPEKRCWEKRDEAWHRLQVANYGSEEAFNQQFGTNFDVSADTLISKNVLSRTSRDLCEFEEKDIYGVTYSENWVWLPNYEPMEQLRKDRIIITGDLAEGTGGDYTVFMVHRMIEPGSNKLECVGMYKSNKVPREQVAESIQLLISLYCDPNNILFSYERNMYGDLFLMNLQKNTETHPIISQKFDMSCLVKYYNNNTNSARFEYGLKFTPGNKSTYCKLYKEDYEHGLIVNKAATYHAELTNFTNDGTDHFKASFGHDDMVMATIQLIGVKMSVQYKFMRDEYDEGYEQTNANIYNPYAEMNMVPGIIELSMDMETPESFNRSRLR